ncbi:MAG: TetR/AcrR family transcriptional regulator [Anaerolineae bacterium]|nr:TetR/AcrR family transcriptional regulator [Anaerolineae bacterium]
MSRLPRNTREQILARTRERLLAAAVTEFARDGFAAANVDRISEAAGYAKGTVYNYFPSKRALMLAVVDEVAAAHTRSILEDVAQEADPCRRLERFFRAGFAYVERCPEQVRVMVNAVYGPDAEFKDRVYLAYQRLFAFIAEDILQAGIARGEFEPVDVDLVTALVMTIYLGSSSQVEVDGKVWLDPQRIVTLILDGLRPRGAAGDKR